MITKNDLIKSMIVASVVAIGPFVAADDDGTMTGNIVTIKKAPEIPVAKPAPTQTMVAPSAPAPQVTTVAPSVPPPQVTTVIPSAPPKVQVAPPAPVTTVVQPAPAQAALAPPSTQPAQVTNVAPVAPSAPAASAPAAPAPTAKAQTEQPPRPPLPIPPPPAAAAAAKPQPAKTNRECAKNLAEYKKSPMLIKVLGPKYDPFTKWTSDKGAEILPDGKGSMYVKVPAMAALVGIKDAPLPMEICVDADKPKLAYMMSYGVRHDFDEPRGNHITLSSKLGSATFTRVETGK